MSCVFCPFFHMHALTANTCISCFRCTLQKASRKKQMIFLWANRQPSAWQCCEHNFAKSENDFPSPMWPFVQAISCPSFGPLFDSGQQDIKCGHHALPIHAIQEPLRMQICHVFLAITKKRNGENAHVSVKYVPCKNLYSRAT